MAPAARTVPPRFSAVSIRASIGVDRIGLCLGQMFKREGALSLDLVKQAENCLRASHEMPDTIVLSSGCSLWVFRLRQVQCEAFEVGERAVG